MIGVAVDSSSLQRTFAGAKATDTEIVRRALAQRTAFLPPAVLAEVMSHTEMHSTDAAIALSIPLLPTQPGYWMRAGLLRRNMKEVFGLSIKLPDVLIAQSCLDYDLPLITYDSGFQRLVRAGLKLA